MSKQLLLSLCFLASFLHTAGAQEGELDPAPFSLLESSPFIPDGWVKPTRSESKGKSKSQGRDIEFRGYYTNLKGTLKFNVYDKRQRTVNWLELKKEKQGLIVQSWNAKDKAITLSVNGKSDRFELMKPDDKPLALTKKTGRSTRKRSVRNTREDSSPNRKVRRTVRKPVTNRSANSSSSSISRVRARSSGGSIRNQGVNINDLPPPPTTAPGSSGSGGSGSGDSGSGDSGSSDSGNSSSGGFGVPASSPPDIIPGPPPSQKPPGIE